MTETKEKLVVNKTEAAARLGICTSTLTIVLAKPGAPKAIHNHLFYYPAIVKFLDKLAQADSDEKQHDEDSQEYWNNLAKKRATIGNGKHQVPRHQA